MSAPAQGPLFPAEPPLCRFRVDGLPMPQGSKTPRIVGKRVRLPSGETAIVNPRVMMIDVANMETKSRKAHALDRWRELVARAARASYRRAPVDGAVVLTADFELPRPESHYTKSGRLKKGAPLYPGSKPDLSKVTRAIEDSLTGVVYTDDARIVGYGQAHRKRYAPRGKDPGVSITVELA